MQKISTYLYPNRVQLLADLAGFDVEYTNVYQRIVKIYRGIDNVVEFDIKNADQKRIELVTNPSATPPTVAVVSDIELNVMDAAGLALPNSPYTVTPHPDLKGIAVVTIPAADLANLNDQFLTYSVTATKDSSTVMLYGDTRFGATGKMELVGSAIPVEKEAREFKTFTAEIDLQGLPISHSSAISAKFYEAIPTTTLNFNINFTGFKGSFWIEATTDSTISVDSFKTRGEKLEDTVSTFASPTTGNLGFDLAVGDYKYFRVSYQNSNQQDVTIENPMGVTGSIDIVIVN